MASLLHLRIAPPLTACLLSICICMPADAGRYVVSIKQDNILLNGHPVKIIGLRTSNALVSDAATDALIGALDQYARFGVNSVSVFLMGSRFGDVKGYRPDATIDPTYSDRMSRIIQAADQRGMIVIVGCLYWSTSKAKEELNDWTQEDANAAIANTARWLKQHDYRNVILDPDNEGMAVRAMKWDAARLIEAAHSADPAIVVANNTKQTPSNADLNMHFGTNDPNKPWLESEGTPGNAPGGYWGSFSKQTHQKTNGQFYNYSRIGRYTKEMQANQLEKTQEQIDTEDGHVLASTWLQCAPAEAVDGPFVRPGGQSELGSGENDEAAWNQDIDTLHPDAGIRWWLEFIQQQYGPWQPPAAR
jgi:hypothetical protein